MKKTIEINYGTSITMNRGNYENFKPMWHQKTMIEINGETPEQIEAMEDFEFARLKKRLDKFANDEFEKSKLDLANLRVRIKDGKKYVSATSVINPDKIEIKNIELYAAKGTEYHKIVNHFLLKQEWIEPEIDIAPLKWDIPVKEFFEKYGKLFSKFKLNLEVFNEKHLYSGELDYWGLVNGKPTVLDFKTGSWKLEQLIAYAKCTDKAEQLAIADLKNCDLILFPIESQKCIEAWESFLKMRGAITARFGL